MKIDEAYNVSVKTRAIANLAYGQLLLALFLALCVALHPGFVLKANEGGMSNYGIHLKTAAAYSLSLVFPVFFSFRAARLLTGDWASVRNFRLVLWIYGWLIFLTLVSTYVYSLNNILRDLHIVIGAALALFQVVASVWMYRLLRRVLWDGVLLGLELAGFVLAVFTIAGALHLLFLTQVLTSGAFAVLMIHSAIKVESGSPPSDLM